MLHQDACYPCCLLDGVSEGQFATVIEDELPLIRSMNSHLPLIPSNYHSFRRRVQKTGFQRKYHTYHCWQASPRSLLPSL